MTPVALAPYNEWLTALLIGLLFSLSSGVRVTLPLLALNLLAYHHLVTLPPTLTWLGAESTLIILGIAAIAETLVYFVPAAGTALKGAATPLAFVAGTLLMAVPLGHQNPLYQWTLAAVFGGGAATLTHLGVLGLRTLTTPADVATGGLFGFAWNLGEIFLAALGSLLAMLAVVLGSALALLGLLLFFILGLWEIIRWLRKRDAAS